MIRRQQIARISGFILLLGFGLGSLLLLMLPDLIETRILPRIARQAGLPSLICPVNHLGFTQISAGPLTLGTEANPALRIERLKLFYNPASIRKGELKKVVLNGVSIKTVFSKGTLSLPGLEEVFEETTENELDGAPASPSRLPILPFTKLEIERSVLYIKATGKEYQIPFSLQLKQSVAPKPGATLLKGTLAIYPRSTPITLEFTAILGDKERLHLNLQAPKIDLLSFADIFNLVPGLNLKGLIALKAEADLSLSPPEVENLIAGIEVNEGGLTVNSYHISAVPNQKTVNPKSVKSEQKNQTLILNLQKNAPAAPWQLNIDQFSLNAPFNPTVSGINISIKTDPGNISLEGRLTTRLAEPYDSFTWIRPLLKKWHFTANLAPQGEWEARLESPADNSIWQVREEVEDLTISGKSPAVTLTARSQEESMAATLQFTDGTLRLPDYDLQVLGIAGTLPWRPLADEQKAELKGKFNCRKILLERLDLGRFAASLQQQGEKILLKGRYDSALVSGLKIVTEGQCEFDQTGTLQAEATFKLPAYKPETPVALGKFSSSADGYSVDGTLSAHGELTYDTHGACGSAVVIIKEASLSNLEKNLLCSGINCRLQFPELPSLRSAPDQRLVFDNLTAGNIICRDGCLAFQIESDETLLLEKSRISWCGGNIETQALRISPDIDHYQSTLYCDRLQLAKLLEQLGQVEARGQGSVNGRIPITWKEGKIRIDDGFLYSTPGIGGSIKISGGQALTAGLPTNSPQFAQLDLAREALKDYQYQWARLGLNSEAEELVLNLQFDGKPNLPLPFVYKTELGGFARVTAGSPGSHFQGISLDINLRLPLNRILQYKELSTIVQ